MSQPPPVDDPSILTWMAQRTLEVLEDFFGAAGIELPEKRVVAYGSIPRECPFLAVVVADVYIGPVGIPESQATRCNAPRTISLEIILTRCVPTRGGSRGQAPSEDAVLDSSNERLIDAWLLLDAVPIISAEASDGADVIAAVAAIPPEGGLSGSVLTLQMAVK